MSSEENNLQQETTESQIQETNNDSAISTEQAVENVELQESPAASSQVEETPKIPDSETAPVEAIASQELPEKVEQAQVLASEVAAEVAETEKTQEIKEEAEAQRENKFEEVFAKLKEVQQQGGSVDVLVKSRIRGGLRVVYENMPLFLPTSHFSLKRNPPEEELQKIVGTTIQVYIHELQEDENGRKTVIVSRKKIAEDELWSKLQVGQIVEGAVSSIASFGVFIDLGGVEGLIHISRLSQIHVHDPKNLAKKGDILKCIVVEADREKNRIALSRKELEDSPWKDIEKEFIPGTIYKGIVRRITEFGAYVEMKRGVDGLLRSAELSWTRRIKSPAEVLTPNTEIDVFVMSVSEEKQSMTLSLKRKEDNPWRMLVEKYPVGAEFKGIVMQVVPQGAILRIDDYVDGFMPKSKIKNLNKGKIPYNVGEEIEITISDIIPDDESLILSPKNDGEPESKPQTKREFSPRKERNEPEKQEGEAGSFTFLDMLSDKDKDSLFDRVS